MWVTPSYKISITPHFSSTQGSLATIGLSKHRWVSSGNGRSGRTVKLTSQTFTSVMRITGHASWCFKSCREKREKWYALQLTPVQNKITATSLPNIDKNKTMKKEIWNTHDYVKTTMYAKWKKQNCWINSVLKSLQVILNTGRLNNRYLAFVLEKSKPDSEASIQYLTSQAYIYSITDYINSNEIPGELSRENLISSHVKISPLLGLHNKSRLSHRKSFKVKWFGISLVFI